MTMGEPRYGSGDPSSRSRVRPGPADLPVGGRRQTTGSGRRLGQIDTGTVALSITGMAFYWLMPALMSRRGPRRRTRRSRASQ